MKKLFLAVLFLFSSSSLFPQSLVEMIQIYGFDEGAAIIKSGGWQVLTKTTYNSIESSFYKAVPVGYTREYYVGIRQADNIASCATRGVQYRFWFSWTDRGGFYFDVPKTWGSTLEGNYHWVKIPGSEAQRIALGETNGYWRLDARVPESCPTSTAYIYGVYLKAIDVAGTLPPQAVGQLNQDPEANLPAHTILGIGGGLFEKEGSFGIRTHTPDASLDIYNQSENGDNLILSANYADANRWRFRTVDRGGAVDLDITASNASDVQETVLRLSRTTSGRPEFALNENWLVANNGKIGIGITSPHHELDVKGEIHSQEVIVDMNGWPDYVFDSTYNLPPLSEVEAYIKTNKHLPEIPSEAEVKENGVAVGEMNALLLKKIEELTLYVIELEKSLKAQQNEINDLRVNSK